MKKWISGFVAAVFLLAFTAPVFADTQTQTVNVTATVSGALSMTVSLFKNDINGDDITATGTMDFGELVDLGTGSLRSSPASTTGTGAVLALITVNSHGVPWQLTQTGSNMTSGTNTLETGSLAVNPVFVTTDNGGATDDGTIGTPGTWVAPDKLLYSSNAAGSLRTIRAYYSITDDDTAGGSTPVIPLDKPAGTYNGTVIFTATA